MQEFLNDLKTFATTTGVDIANTVTVFVLGLLAVRIIIYLANRLLLKGNKDKTVIKFGLSIFRVGLYLLWLLGVATAAGISTQNFVTVLSAIVLAVGLALGAALPDGEAALLSAFGLAVGIAVQNFPEGAAVALPMRTATGSAKKAFLLGSASGAVEPLFAGVGLLLAAVVRPLQPWLLAFAAGAMIFVVAEELIPDSRSEMSPHTGALGFLAGFVIMMILDIALG